MCHLVWNDRCNSMRSQHLTSEYNQLYQTRKLVHSCTQLLDSNQRAHFTPVTRRPFSPKTIRYGMYSPAGTNEPMNSPSRLVLVVFIGYISAFCLLRTVVLGLARHVTRSVFIFGITPSIFSPNPPTHSCICTSSPCLTLFLFRSHA